MTDQQVTDIVAWLASKRVANPGQPYPNASLDQSDGMQSESKLSEAKKEPHGAGRNEPE